MPKILVLLPILKNAALEQATRQELSRLDGPGLNLEVRSLEHGPASIESEFDDRLASPWVLEEVVKAEREGFNAVYVSCMGDIAINAARELVRIPVIGPYQACLAVAACLGDRTGVVTILKNVIPLFIRKAREYGFSELLAGVRSIEVPVLELEERRKEVVEALVEESKALVEKDGADSIILGCTGLVGLAQAVQERLGVPVLDPTPVSVKLAELLLAAGVSHSPKAYMRPPEKLRRIPALSSLAGNALQVLP